MADSISITANGRDYTVNVNTALPDFVRERGLDPDRVVVEHNGQALTRKEASTLHLTAGDRLEIVRIVAGG